MSPFEEEEHIRNLLADGSMMTHEQKFGLIAQIRNNAISAIVKIRPETITEGHDLTAPSQAYHFIGELRKEAIPLTHLTHRLRMERLRLAAYLDLLEACTRSVDNGQINENAICTAYRKTDGGLIMGAGYSKDQSEKGKLRGAQQSREKAKKDEVEIIHGRGNVSAIINGLALTKDQLGDYLSPKDELWPELIGALGDLGLRPNEVYDNSGNPLRIDYRDGDGKTGEIKFSSFKSMVSTARKS